MFFNSVYDGLYYLNINDTVRYLTVFHSKESYEYFTQNGRILYSVGQGYKRTSGHPSGHQYFLKQILLNSKYQSDYPVFRIFSDAVEYMGNYRLLSYKKKMSFEGFMYYEYKLFINSVYIPRSSENDIAEEYMTGREVMEVIGTDIFRTIKEDIWVSRTIDIALKNNKALSIISDCRFPNEIEEIKNRGGKVIRLMRDPFNTKTLSESALDKDSYDWDNFDYIIDNRDMSLLDMSIKIQEVINDITINNNK